MVRSLRRILPALAAALLAAAPAVSKGAPVESSRKAVVLSRAGSRSFQRPVDISVDRRGVVYVLDAGSRSVILMGSGGDLLREIPGKGLLRDPHALVVSGEGTVLVADGTAGRVAEIDLSGRLRREYPGGKGARITGVALYGDSVFAVDAQGHRVLVFKRKGGAPETWGKKGDRPGEFDNPYRVAVDSGGRVFVTDVMNSRVQWFTPFGQHLGTVRRFGAGPGRLLRPSGISIDLRGRPWVTDSYSGLVQLFGEGGDLQGTIPKSFLDPVGVLSLPEGTWVADQRDGKVAFFRK